jgi:deazaflavin-dependent oxidoreductase (nitroreductase family)
MRASLARALRWEAIAERFNIFAMHRALYRALGGHLVGRNLLILTTTGRRTGQPRSTLLYYVRNGEDYVVIASNGGDDWYPGWWHNIRANPDVEIEVGRSRIPCKAEPVRDADRRPLFAQLVGVNAVYAKYEQRTTRELTLHRLRARALRP